MAIWGGDSPIGGFPVPVGEKSPTP